MKISVIIPVYNVERYLRPCVECVLSQSHKNLQVILVDDGSTDSSGSICDGYAASDSRVQVIHKQNGGLSDARNAGLHTAIGDYVLFLDSDDRWNDEFFVEHLIQRAEETSADVIFFELVRWVDGDPFPPMELLYNENDFIGSSANILKNLLRKNQFSMSACQKLIRTSILKNNAIEFPIGLLGEDMDWIQRLWPCVQSVSFSNEAKYFYRCRSGSITTTFGKRNMEDFCSILEHWKLYWEGSTMNEKRIYLGYLAYLYITLVYRLADMQPKDFSSFYPRVEQLASLLDYSITPKSNRLVLLRRICGTASMLRIICFLRNRLHK